VPNPEGTLVDGQLIRAMVEEKKPEEKILIPQAALIADQQGAYVFIVEDGKAAVRRIKLGAEKGADIVIEEGLKGGEQVVVQGMQTLRAGAAVIASPMPASAG
jgi:membrane fusion protein (multidrug efflux system)